MALVTWALALRLTGLRRVAIIATILVCIGGGMGWLRLVGDLIAGGPGSDLGTLLTHNPYDNSWADGWPFFRIASVLGTGFLPHRATTLGLPGLVAVVLLVATCLDRRPAGVLLAGVLAALLAPFQFYAFPATYLIVAAVRPDDRRLAAAQRVGATRPLFLAPLVLAIPFIADAVVRQRDVGAFQFVAGWSEARFEQGPLGVLFFYATNLGLPVRPGDRLGGDGTRPRVAPVPRRLDGRAVPDPQRGPGQRGRLRHEQVLPDHVDRGRDPRGLADPAAGRGSPSPASSRSRRSRPGSSSSGTS